MTVNKPLPFVIVLLATWLASVCCIAAPGAGIIEQGDRQAAAGDMDAALETYLRIGYLHPLEAQEASRAMLRAGILLEGQGRTEQARKVWEKVRDNGADPWNKEAALRLKAGQGEP